MNSNLQKICHLTFHKCGSQWVRDVLTAPEVAGVSGVRLDGRSPNMVVEAGWPSQEPGTFLGPIYSAGAQDWKQRPPDDARAVVVVRDPRDRLISWVFSVAHSHVGQPLLREPLLALSRRSKIIVGMFELVRVSGRMRSWFETALQADVFLTSYERLIQDERGEFRRIVQFLGWEIPETHLDSAIARLSFSQRSGRLPGQANIHSHYRRGVSGDWRNYFDRSLGALFEERLPGLLTTMGYEARPNWHESLPERLADDEPAQDEAGQRIRLQELESEVVLLREERDELRRNCALLQQMIAAAAAPPPSV